MKKILSVILSVTLISSLFINVPPSYAANTTEETTVVAEQVSSYDSIQASLLANHTYGSFNPTEVKATDVGTLIKQVVQENPEILYYKSAKVWASGKIEFNYSIDANQIAKNRVALNNKVNTVAASIKKTAQTDFDKIKAVHDYLVLNTTYDYKNQQNKTIPQDSYTAYGALIKGVAVCDGYTKAAQILFNRLGIESEYVVGTVNETLHAWNQVKLNGKYYFVDITWDDPVPNKPGKVDYNYFLITSSQLKIDHTWNETQWAKATDAQYSYFKDMKDMVQVGGKYYYSSKSDSQKLYQIAVNGKNKAKVNNVRAPYFVVVGKEIYFSNYSNGGYLYKMDLNAKNLKKLNSIHSIDLKVVNNKLQFINKKTKKIVTLPLNTKLTANKKSLSRK